MLNRILKTEAGLFISAVAVIEGAAAQVGINQAGLDAGFLRDYADGSIRIRNNPLALSVTVPFVVALGVATLMVCVIALMCTFLAKQDETRAASETRGSVSVSTLGYITIALIAVQVALSQI